MIREWQQRLKLYSARLRIERSGLIAFPHFKTTLFLLWIVALTGLLYGHVVNMGPVAEPVSLLLSLLGWLGTTFILLLKNPLPRLKLLLTQVISIILFGGLLLVLSVTYSILFLAANVITSIKVAWISASALLGGLTLYMLFTSFLAKGDPTDPNYPGKRTAPLLFLLLVINYLLWSWQDLMRWLR